MDRIIRISLAALLALYLLFVSSTSSLSLTASPEVKIYPPSLLKDLRKDSDRVTVIVSFRNCQIDRVREATADSSWWKGADRGARLTGMYEALKRHADDTQRPVLYMLEESAKRERKMTGNTTSAMEVKQLWITNQVTVRDASRRVLEELAAHPEVSSIAQERIFQLRETVSLQNSSSLAAIAQPDTWSLLATNVLLTREQTGCTGSNVRVGVLDTGMAPHPDLPVLEAWHNAIDGGPQKDDNGHGTHVSGIIAAKTVGVSPGVKLMMAKVCTFDGKCPESAILDGSQFMICPSNPSPTVSCAGAPQIVSMSIGGLELGIVPALPIDTPPFMATVLATMKSVGIAFFSAAGNEAAAPASPCLTRVYPAYDDNIFASVCATDKNKVLSSFSLRSLPTVNSGLSIRGICSPGSNIVSTWPGGSYMTLSGTSMATPHVAGAVALLLQALPGLPLEQIKLAMFNGADKDVKIVAPTTPCDISPAPNNQIGHGQINVLNMFKSFSLPKC